MRIIFGGSSRVAAVAALFLVSAANAQDAVPQPPDAISADAPATTTAADSNGGEPDSAAGNIQGERANPHLLLDGLSGGPKGSPTAQRGNPQPGTSTSIPTTNPATIRPVEQIRSGNPDVAVENTGISGQCDPVVSIGCPSVADQFQPSPASISAGNGTDEAQPAPETSAEPAQADN